MEEDKDDYEELKVQPVPVLTKNSSQQEMNEIHDQIEEWANEVGEKEEVKSNKSQSADKKSEGPKEGEGRVEDEN